MNVMNDQDLDQAVRKIAKSLDDKRFKDIRVLDMRGIITYCDYFVIATGSNKRQLSAAHDDIRELWKELADVPVRPEGSNTSDWSLIDLGDMVIHLFTEDGRSFYDLDTLWSEAAEVEV